MEKKTYSITAYRLNLKKRDKMSKIDELKDYTEYLINKKKFINDFISYLNSIDYNDKNNYFELVEDTQPIYDVDIEGHLIFVNYGRNGREFSTIDEDQEFKYYNEKAKYISYYKIFFFIIKNELYLVAFRQSQYGCKGAICNEIRKFLNSSNITFDESIVSNERYVNEIIDNSTLHSLSYSTINKVNKGETTKIKKEHACNVSVMLNIKEHKNILENIKLFFKETMNGITKKTLVTELESHFTTSSIMDEESMKVEISYNGNKRIVNLSDLKQMMYDIDITSKLEFDKNNNPTLNSIILTVLDYMKGINIKYE